MKGYVFISEKNQSSKNYLDDIKEILSEYNGISNVEVKESEGNNHTTKLYTFTNEQVVAKTDFGDYSFGYAGDFVNEESAVFKGFRESKNKDVYMSNLGGIYTLSVLHENVFEAWNNVTRVEPIFWSENSERIVVGTRAILVHLIANNIRTPEYKSSNFISFLNNGFYADENAPYQNLNVLPSNSKVKVENHILTINQIDDFEEHLYSIDPSPVTYDELTESYLNSFLFLKRINKPLSIGLTGGKDSRMVAAALNHLNIDFQAKTTGFKTTPDVVVAEMIAKVLGIEHEYVEPSAGKEVIGADLYLRTVNTIKNTEGMLYSYENVGGTSQVFNNNKIIFGGQGGENLRGGYARKHQFENVAQVEKFMLNAFMKYRNLMVPEQNEDYATFIKNFIYKDSSHIHASDMLNHFFLKYRTGRWSASSRPFYTVTSQAYSPLFENQLVKRAQTIKTKYGANDSILYNILQRIAPQLVNIPFANDRWSFEGKHPYHRYDLNNWISRQPIQTESRLSGFNWRQNLLKTSKKQIEEIIFSYDNNVVFDVLDKNKLRNLFEKEQKNPARFDALLWSVYTASILQSNEWYNKPTKASRVSIKVPKASTVKLPNLTEEIRKIQIKNLKSNHPNLFIEEIDSTSGKITWEKFDNKWMYFQLFDNPFPKAASSKYNNISKLIGKKAKFIFEIEKVMPSNFELEVFIIQYKGEKRIKSESITFYITEPKDMYECLVQLQSEATSYKLAFKIAKTTQDGALLFNQLRVEFYS